MLALAACLLASALFAAKQRDWKTGKVIDSTMSQNSYVTGAVTNSSANGGITATTIGNTTTGTANAQSTSSTTVQRVTVQRNELLILGDDYSYIIEDTHRKGGPLLATALANRKHGCRFIVGDDIKYAQEKGDLWVIDADGKECKVPIVRQQKRQ